MAVVKPFRALRYDEALAGPLEKLVAPPYDVISDEQRADLRGRSPHNVVHLTLPDSEEDAARLQLPAATTLVAHEVAHVEVGAFRGDLSLSCPGTWCS